MNTINKEVSLLEEENQNMNTSLKLFEITKQNAEEYCTYIRKYKECTEAYFEKLSKLTYNIKKDNTIANNNLNISSIFSILNKIPQLVKVQIDGIKKFVESLDLTIKPLESVLKNEINSLEEPKKQFEENKKKYIRNMTKHKKIMDILSQTEKKIIKYYLSKKKQKDYIDEKNIMINSLKEAKIMEKEFFEANGGDKNYHEIFQEESLKNIDEIKSHIRIILENLNSCIYFFLCVFYDCYSPCVTLVNDYKNEINSKSIDTKNLINNNMFIKTYKPEELPCDKYVIKILNSPQIKKLSYSIDITNYNTPKFNFINLINIFNKDAEISEDEIFSNLNKIDLLGIAKKMYKNFKLVSKTNYDIKSEEEKIKVKNITDKLILMKKYKKNNKSNEEITKEEINKEEIKELLDLVKKKENSEIFLTRLNKIRSYGNFEYNKKIFDDILNIFLIILEHVEIDKDTFIIQFCLILSQTFYYIEKGQKEYLYKFIKHHEIFHSEEMWEKLLDYIISEKTEQFNEIEYKIQKNNDNEEKKKQKYVELIFAQLIAVIHNMIDFEFDLEKIKKIMVDYINKYNLSETHKQIIMDMISSKMKDINEIEEKNNEK